MDFVICPVSEFKGFCRFQALLEKVRRFLHNSTDPSAAGARREKCTRRSYHPDDVCFMGSCVAMYFQHI